MNEGDSRPAPAVQGSADYRCSDRARSGQDPWV